MPKTEPVTTVRPPARSVASTVISLPLRVLDAAIWIYQKTVSPALAVALPSCGCRFAPTCSHYAREALREHGLLRGVGLAVSRLVRCGPWHPGGIDPVPPRCVRVRRDPDPQDRANAKISNASFRQSKTGATF
jgi:uncharacterized protein